MNRLLFFSVLICIFSTYDLTGERKHIDFNFSGEIGLSGGVICEYVFKNERQISCLEWQQYISPMVYGEAELIFRKLFARFGFLFAIPLQCGILEDYDFLSGSSSVPSHYSYHTVYLDSQFQNIAIIGYYFSVYIFKLAPSFGIVYRFQKFSAYDGYLQYPQNGMWTGNETKQYVSGYGISYEQSMVLPIISINIQYNFNKLWNVNMLFSICPYTIIEAFDSHFFRKRQFFDSMRGGLGFSVKGRITYKNFFIRIAYTWLKVMNGTTKSSTIGIAQQDIFESVQSGTKSWIISISAGYVFQLI